MALPVNPITKDLNVGDQYIMDFGDGLKKYQIVEKTNQEGSLIVRSVCLGVA